MTALILLTAAILAQTSPPAEPPASDRPGVRRISVAAPVGGGTPSTRPAEATSPRPPAAAAPGVRRSSIPATRPAANATAPRAGGRPAAPAGPVQRTVVPNGRPAAPAAAANRPPVPAGTPTTRPAGFDDVAARVKSLAGLTGAPVQVQPTQDGVLLIGNPDDVAIIQALLQQMDDQPNVEPVFQVFQLENGRAATLATQLENLWNKAKIPPAGGGVRAEDRLNIIPEPRANILMVATSAVNMPTIEDIIHQLDRPLSDDTQTRIFEPIKLQHIKADEAAEQVKTMLKDLQTMHKSDTEPATISADPRAGQLLVSASKADFEQIKNLVALIDVPAVPGISAVKLVVFPLRKASADQLVKALTDILAAKPTTGTQNKGIGDQLRRLQLVVMGPNGPQNLPDIDLEKQVRVFPEPGTNSVIVATSEENLQAVQALINMLDTMPLGDDIIVRVYGLEYADAEQLQASLQAMFDKGPDLAVPPRRTNPGDRVPPNAEGMALAFRVSMTVDKRTNTLLVAGRPEQIEFIDSVIKQVDQKDEAGHFTPRLVKLDNADVKTVADLLQKYIDQRQRIVDAGGQNVSRKQSITLLTEPRSNSLIIVANDENFAEVATLVRNIDTAPLQLNGGAQIFVIDQADPARVGDMLDQLLKGIQSTVQDSKTFQYAVVTDPRTRTVLVSGTRDVLKQAGELVSRLDVPARGPAGEFRVYTLKQASSRQIAQVLTDLFDKRTSGSGGSSRQLAQTPVLVQSVDSSNSLLVTAAAEDHSVVENLLTSLDKPSTMADQFRVFPLVNAKAEGLADTLTKLVKDQQSTGGGSAKSTGPPPIAITPEPRTNALLVYGPPDAMANVASLIEKIDQTGSINDRELKIFKLHNARAEDMSKRLDDFFKNATTGSGGSSKDGNQLIIHFTDIDRETGRPVQRTLVHQDIAITPDPATNSLMVMAPQGSGGMMERLVEMLDAVEPRQTEMRVFALRNADAEEMQKMLEALFKASGSGQGGTNTERPTLKLTGGLPAGLNTEIGGVTDVAFTTDRRTNCLIATGSLANLRVIERLVDELDVKDQEDRIARVVRLRYAPAADVATALKAYFDAEASIADAAQAGISDARKAERKVTVQEAGDIQNNILISYSPRMESQIIRMVDQLDVPPPQVMIQVLMAEVSLDDRLEMGMEFALQDLNFSQHSFTTSNGVLQGSGFDKVFGFDLGAQGQSALGGVSFTITGEDFNFLVRALQTEGRLDVLSRPSILVQDSQDATITVGERVPTVQDINISTTGQVTPSVTYEEVGIKLEVTPIINPDGFVNLKIKPEISAIGTSSVTVASGVSLPTFTTRNADTSVTVKDGETIIIGGLITNRENSTENKVPLLGDLPLLGVLARATVKTQTKTELLMVLTPHVIRDAEQARRLSIQMRDETNMIDNIRRNDLMQGLKVTPEEEFGPVLPPDRPSGTMPIGTDGNIYGPTPEEYGPPLSSIQPKQDDTGPTMATFRLHQTAKSTSAGK